MQTNLTQHRLRAGMVGMGMIFDDTYRPFFEQMHTEGLFRRDFVKIEQPWRARVIAQRRPPISPNGLRYFWMGRRDEARAAVADPYACQRAGSTACLGKW